MYQVIFHQIDVTHDPEASGLEELFKKYDFFAVINFAGLKAVGESVSKPLEYYSCNLTIVFNLLRLMKIYNIKRFIFSSSACVYGDPKYLPIDESHPAGTCTNAYGRTKFFIEEILRDQQRADSTLDVIILRYFNPVGAHESGLIGEDPKGIPNNLMPYISQVVVGIRPKLFVFGNDYDTKDGTGVRDYIHVVDLAKGHVAALLKAMKGGCGCKVYNLGTGHGYSVLEMVKGMEKASGCVVQYEIVGRRDGDVPSVYADSTLAEKELNWKACKGLDLMCIDACKWQKSNPTGYS